MASIHYSCSHSHRPTIKNKTETVHYERILHIPTGIYYSICLCGGGIHLKLGIGNDYKKNCIYPSNDSWGRNQKKHAMVNVILKEIQLCVMDFNQCTTVIPTSCPQSMSSCVYRPPPTSCTCCGDGKHFCAPNWFSPQERTSRPAAGKRPWLPPRGIPS